MGFMQYVTLMSLVPSAFCIREVLSRPLRGRFLLTTAAALNDTRLVNFRALSSAQLQLTKS